MIFISLLMHILVYIGDIYTKFKKAILITFTAQCYMVVSLWKGMNCLSEQKCVETFYFILHKDYFVTSNFFNQVYEKRGY